MIIYEIISRMKCHHLEPIIHTDNISFSTSKASKFEEYSQAKEWGMLDKRFLFVSLILALQYHYPSYHPTRIGAQMLGLEYLKKAFIMR